MKLLESEFLTFGKNLKQCSHLSFILQVFLAPDQKQTKKLLASFLQLQKILPQMLMKHSLKLKSRIGLRQLGKITVFSFFFLNGLNL